MLGIALCGVGYVAAISGNDISFPRRLMCYGASLTSLTLALSTALHKPADGAQSKRHAEDFRIAQRRKVVLLGVCSALFLFPLALQLPTLAVAALVVAVQLASLIGQIEISSRQIVARRNASHKVTDDDGDHSTWRFRRPRLLVEWQKQPENSQLQLPLVGAHVSSQEHFFTYVTYVTYVTLPLVTRVDCRSQEHFFTVLLAVAVFSINELLRDTHDLEASVAYVTYVT